MPFELAVLAAAASAYLTDDLLLTAFDYECSRHPGSVRHVYSSAATGACYVCVRECEFVQYLCMNVMNACVRSILMVPLR